MPIDTPHPEYAARLPQWKRCRDCYDGADAVKAAAEVYLPRLSGQEAAEYDAYRLRATFYNAYARTVSALSGVLFRKPVQPQGPTSLADQWIDVTGGGHPLDLFALSLGEELFKVGRAGVLVDAPVEGGDPYWCLYRAEAVLSWDERRVAGVPTLQRVVLYEHVLAPDPKDPYTLTLQPRIRELALVGAVYTVQLWKLDDRQVDGGGTRREWVKDGPVVVPIRRGQALPFIPFTFVNATDLLVTPARPPMLDLADVNLSHYRTSADLEHGRHFTALPTPWVTGYDGKGGTLTVGSERAWALSNENAAVGMLEFTGAGLSSLERALEHKEREMAVLGARLLETQKAGVEAEGTVRMRHAGDDATLRVVATILSAAVTRVMRWHAWWLGVAGEPDAKDVAYALGVEFFSVRLNPGEVQALVNAYQAGAMSFDTLYWNLQRGDVAQPNVTAEQERHRIDAESGDDGADDDDEDDAEATPPAGEDDQEEPPADDADADDDAEGGGDDEE